MRLRHLVLLFAFAAAVLVTPALAQAPGGPGGPGGGGFQMPPEFQKFQQQHKYHSKLGGMVTRGFPELEKDKSTALTPAQAKQVLAILKPWQSKDKMTADQAKTTIKSLQKVLTPKQLTVLGKVPERGFGGGGRGGGGGGGGGPRAGGPGGGGPGGGGPGGFGGGGPRPGGPGGPGGGRGFNLAAMKNYNPFATKAADPSNRMATRRAERAKYTFAMLAARAANKPLPKMPQTLAAGRPGAPGR